MTEPIIASLTDPEAGLAEHLMQAQLLINERDAWRQALKTCNSCLQMAIPAHNPYFNLSSDNWFDMAIKELESEKIDSGKVA